MKSKKRRKSVCFENGWGLIDGFLYLKEEKILLLTFYNGSRDLDQGLGF